MLTTPLSSVESAVSPEGDRILEVFRAHGLRSGSTLHPTDFGEAIVWEHGPSVRDEPVRAALAALFEGGYLLEYLNGFQLTDLGAAHLYGESLSSDDGLLAEPSPEVLRAGVYTRKGSPYLLIGLARMHEDGDEYVVYIPLYTRPEFGGSASMSLRPSVEFREAFEWAGSRIP